MPFNEIINWPGAIDTFPTLRDNTGPSVADDQILYAEHYNKIGNFLLRAQAMWTNTTVVTGDGTIKTLYFPSDPTTIGFAVPFPVVAKISCPWAYDGRSSGTNIPGNVLPFEYVLTQDTGIVIPWHSDSYHMAFQNQDATAVNNLLKGYSYTAYPRFQCSVWKNNAVQTLGGGTAFTHYVNEDFIVNCWGVMGTQTLIIRGTIVDMSGDSPSGGIERWDMYPDWSLVCVLQGVRSA